MTEDMEYSSRPARIRRNESRYSFLWNLWLWNLSPSDRNWLSTQIWGLPDAEWAEVEAAERALQAYAPRNKSNREPASGIRNTSACRIRGSRRPLTGRDGWRNSFFVSGSLVLSRIL
jgi:hypothetical protein